MHTRISFRKTVLGMAASSALLCMPAMAASHAIEERSPGMIDTQSVFAQLGLTPDLLSASGVNQSEASSVFIAAYNALSLRWTNYSAAQSALDVLFADQASISQQLKAVDLDVSERVQLQAQLENTKQLIHSQQLTLQSLRNDIDGEALDSMSTDDRTSFEQIRANKSHSVPVEYRILDIDDADWIELRHALAVIKTNDDPSLETRQVVSGYDGMYEVNLARVNHETHFHAVNTVFTSFLVSRDAND